jgi:hypothetical protein
MPPESSDWAVAIPATKDVHLPPNPKQNTRPLTNAQLGKLGKELMESFLRRVVTCTGYRQRRRPTASALAQLIKMVAGSSRRRRQRRRESARRCSPSPRRRNKVLSPNFEVESVKAFPYGTPEIGYRLASSTCSARGR